jgi:hypothetical protein
MGGRWRLIVAGMLLISALGTGVWTWWLAGKTVEVADQWSSVLAGIATLLFAPAGLVVGVLALRAPGTAPSTPAQQQPVSRTQTVQADTVSAPIINGDENRVNW